MKESLSVSGEDLLIKTPCRTDDLLSRTPENRMRNPVREEKSGNRHHTRNQFIEDESGFGALLRSVQGS